MVDSKNTGILGSRASRGEPCERLEGGSWVCCHCGVSVNTQEHCQNIDCNHRCCALPSPKCMFRYDVENGHCCHGPQAGRMPLPNYCLAHYSAAMRTRPDLGPKAARLSAADEADEELRKQGELVTVGPLVWEPTDLRQAASRAMRSKGDLNENMEAELRATPAKRPQRRYRGAQVNKENLYELADALGLDEEVLRKRNYTTPQLVDLLVAQGQTLVFAAKALDMWKREAERLTKKFQAALSKDSDDG